MRILLAEPSAIGRKILSAIAAEGGHQVVLADDAGPVLDFIHSGQEFDVLITAIEFETMSGFELCWDARLAIAENRPVYIIVLSSCHDEDKLVEALDCGADEFVTKPPRKSEILARLRAAERLLSAQRDLIRFASYDALTELRNRRSFFEELDRLSPQSGLLSVMMLDIDFFKRINDQFGHDAGDDVLREFARRAREIDPGFARIGGEEFALVVRAPLLRAGEIAELLRRKVSEALFTTSAGDIPVTISIGVAERHAGATPEAIMKEADIALYASKSGGRDRVTLAMKAPDAGIMHLNLSKVA